jgi:hypothetical protein
MTLRSEKILSQILVIFGVFLSLEALVYILNLNQQDIYIHLALFIFVYITLKFTFYFDLHFKSSGVLACKLKRHASRWDWLACRLGMLRQYAVSRFVHFRHWRTLRHWINCLGLPWLLYWGTVAIIFLNFHRSLVQQSAVVLSGIALSLIFWHLKEIYLNQGENVSEVTHVTLQTIKLYTAFVIFLACIGLAHYFCLPYTLFCLAIFGSIFTLMYQSLFHMQQINLKAIGSIFIIAAIITVFSGLVFVYWGLSNPTAALFLLGLYNFFWGVYSYHLRKRLSWAIFMEHLLITVLITGLSFGTTNFKAQLLPYC